MVRTLACHARGRRFEPVLGRHFFIRGMNVIITKTPTIEGKTIREYKGLVFGEIIAGVNFIKDFSAGIANIFGGRASSYEGELIEARENAIREMQDRAMQIGANAVVGVSVDYETLGNGGSMLMVVASGTGVIVE